MFCRFPVVLLFQLSSKTPPELRYSCIPCSSEQGSFACLSSSQSETVGQWQCRSLTPGLTTQLISRRYILSYLELTACDWITEWEVKLSRDQWAFPWKHLSASYKFGYNLLLMCLCDSWPLPKAKCKVKNLNFRSSFNTLLPMPRATFTTPEQDISSQGANTHKTGALRTLRHSTNTVRDTFKWNVLLIPLMFSNPDTLHVSLNTILYLIPRILRHLLLTWMEVKRFACSLPGNQSLIPTLKERFLKEHQLNLVSFLVLITLC